MSEESAHESEGELVMHRHTPVYRSEGRVSWGSSYSSASYPRVVCSPAECDPRPNAPTWAVKSLSAG